jgi:hypothetical protein
MGDENKIRDAADAVKGVAEAVPLYQDLLQPAVQEVGKGLQTVAKLVHVALAPLSMVVWGYDQIRDYLQETITEKLKNVPPEQIVPPKMTIAGPTVEALRFAAHEPNLRELYANLLATSMNSETVQNAHPAFVEIIKQLTPDEARMLKYLFNTDDFSHEVVDMVVIAKTSKKVGSEVVTEPFSHGFNSYDELATASNCTTPDLVRSYIDNLRRLGLWSINEGTRTDIVTTTHQKEVREFAVREVERIIKEKGLTGYIYHSYLTSHIISFTDFGDQFCEACISNS